MKKILFTLLFSALFLTLNSCIAMKNDVDMAKSELRAETNQSLKDEVDKLNASLNKIEKVLKNNFGISFSDLEELRKAITELNKRIDSLDLKVQKSTGVAEQLAALEKKIADNEKEIANLKKEIEDLRKLIPSDPNKCQINLLKNEEENYKDLVNYTKNQNNPVKARKCWEDYAKKWPESRKCDVTFWTGETYFMEKSYNKVIETLQPIERNYPGCVQIESSYFKIAFSLFHTGKVDVANAVLQTMKEKFPKSASSDKVKELEKLIQSKMPKKTAPAKKAEPPKKAPAKQQTKTPAKTKK